MVNQKPQNYKKRSVPKKDSFLEVFRDLGPQDNLLFQKEAELEKRYRSQLRQTEIVRREGQVLFSHQQKEAEQKVNALQEEIKNLAKATGELAREAEIAAMQEAPIAGTYHVNFFERLIRLIKSLKSKIQESSFWLAAWNKKAQKRNFYWGQFKKSGSKFMLSADRYMSTQAG